LEDRKNRTKWEKGKKRKEARRREVTVKKECNGTKEKHNRRRKGRKKAVTQLWWA